MSLIVWPYLTEALNKMKGSHYLADDVKILLLARDYLIIMEDEEVDWIGIVKNLMEVKEFGIIVRVLRYLKLDKLDMIDNM